MADGKNCRVCGVLKSWEDFPRRTSSKDGYNHRCSSCQAQYNAEYARSHRDAKREANHRYRERHAGAIRERAKARNRALARAREQTLQECLTARTGKTCRLCGQFKPLSAFFPRDGRDGYRNDCKNCHNGRSARFRREKPEQVTQAKRAWYQRNRERVRLKNARYQRANREAIRQTHQRYYRIHGERIRARISRYQKQHPEIAAESRHRRRARLKACFIGRVHMHQIYARDRGICQICGKKLPRAVASLDHIIPISHGGPHVEWNVQIAHRRCNQRRGAGLIPAQIRLPLD